eukprot:4102358-Lingulodinium_polyedra.AAC.1
MVREVSALLGDLQRRHGKRLRLVVAADTNCTLRHCEGGLAGPLVLPPARSHKPAMRTLVDSFLAKFGFKLTNTYESPG